MAPGANIVYVGAYFRPTPRSTMSSSPRGDRHEPDGFATEPAARM
jgi:hypothetical protein